MAIVPLSRTALRDDQPPAPVPAADPFVPLRTVRRQPTSTAVLLIASFGAFLAFLDSTIVNIAFPDIRRSFPESSIGTLSWVLNAYNIVFAAFLIAAGRFADLLGRKRMFVSGVVVFTAASVLCAVAGTVGQLIAFRVLQGIGAAMLVPASLALVVEGFDPRRRAHGVGLWGAAAAIASGLGPPIGGALVNVSSWRLAFLVNLPLGVLAVVVARRGLVESRSPGRRRAPDVKGALLLAAALGLLTLGLVQGPDWGWTSAAVVASFVGAAVALGNFVVSSATHPSPLVEPALLRLRSFSVGNAVTVVAGAGFYAYLLTHVLYLSSVWEYSLLRAGLAVAPAAFVAAVVASVLGKVADARGHRLVAVPGALLWAASLFWYLERVGTSPAFLTQWLPGQVLQGIGVGATLPILGSAALAALPKGGSYATASAVVSSARQLGAVVGIAVLVILVGTPTPETAVESLRRGWVLAACCFLVVAAGSALLGRTTGLTDRGDEVEAPAAALPPAPPPVQPVFHVTEPASDDLADLPLFASLDGTALVRLRRAAVEVQVDAGDLLFAQGDPADALYVVRTGRLAVVQDGVVLTELGRGGVLGELGLLTGEPRSASVRAVRDATLARLRAEDFHALADVGVMTALAGSLARRLAEIAPTPGRRGTDEVVVAVVALDPGVDVDRVGYDLVYELSRFTTVVAPGRLDAAGLEQAEQAARTVVLVAGLEDPRWHAWCLRVADRVVQVSSLAAPPDADEAHPPRPGADLVLTRPGTREGRAAWEAACRPRSVHQVRPGVSPDLRPLAARVAGRSLGLVLGGGGARGLAHLGVLAELEAAGVAVDRFAGTSIGSVVAAAAAHGWDADAVDAVLYENFVRRNPIGDYTVPTKGLIRGHRTRECLDAAVGGRLIEELPREFRAVSVDLLERRPHVHRSGRIADAVGSSLRLPGLYPPLAYGGTLHVDGGVLDNLPVSALDRREGPIVAVSVGFGAGPAPAGQGSRRHERHVRVPPLGDTLLRTMMLASGAASAAAIEAADVVLRPDAEGVGLLEFHQIDRMREAGRATARAALPEIVEALARADRPAQKADGRPPPQR